MFRSLAVHFSSAKFSKSPSGRVCTVMSHNLKNIYPRMLNTMWTLIQTCTLIPTPFTRTCASRMAHPDITNLPPGGILMAHRRSKWTNSEAGLKASSPFTNLLLLCPKTAPCPEAATQATTTAAAADQQQTIAKPSQNLSGLGFDWLQFWRGPNEVQTRSKRGPKSDFGRLTP